MIDLKEIISLPNEHRQLLQELLGYSLINDLEDPIYGPETRKLIENRLRDYCNKPGAVVKFEDIKAGVLDKFKT